MSGEIFNNRYLLKTNTISNKQKYKDIEAALHYYHQDGLKFGKCLNGLFSIGILDQRKKIFILLNDRFGTAHQVYWIHQNSRFYFATHLKALLTLSCIQKEINYKALNLFLKYSYISSPWTIFKNIHKLPPGNILVFNGKKTAVTPYWKFNQQMYPITDSNKALRTYKHLLQQSISQRIGAGENVGILLSGGLDSSANVALAAECSKKRLKTFSIGFTDPQFDERPYARLVSRHFDTQHYEYTITGKEIDALPALIWNIEEPYFEAGLFLTYLVMKSAKNEVNIVLGGEGADQLFGTGGFAMGLPIVLRYLFLKSNFLGPLTWITKHLKGDFFYKHDNFAFKLRVLLNRITDLNHWYFYGYDEYELRKLHKNRLMTDIPQLFNNHSFRRPSSYESLYQKTLINQDTRHYINENLMVKSGRMADMFDLTLRESYLDVNVTDYLVSLEYRFKRSGNLLNHLNGNTETKYLHKIAMENIIPAKIIKKPKQGGFVPMMVFLNDKKLREKIYNHLYHSELINNYFRIDYLTHLFTDFEYMQRKKRYWHSFYDSKAIHILFLLTFDIWHHFFIINNAIDIEPPTLNEYLNK